MKSRREFLNVAGTTLAIGSAIHDRAIASVNSASDSDEISFTKWYDVDRSIVINRRNVPFVRGVMPDESLPVELEKVRASVDMPVACRLPST